MTMREQLLEQGVLWYLDDSLNTHDEPYPIDENVRLIGFQCGFEVAVVAVKSYLPNIRLSDQDAMEIAEDYLKEIKWSDNPDLTADYCC